MKFTDEELDIFYQYAKPNEDKYSSFHIECCNLTPSLHQKLEDYLHKAQNVWALPSFDIGPLFGCLLVEAEEVMDRSEYSATHGIVTYPVGKIYHFVASGIDFNVVGNTFQWFKAEKIIETTRQGVPGRMQFRFVSH